MQLRERQQERERLLAVIASARTIDRLQLDRAAIEARELAQVAPVAQQARGVVAATRDRPRADQAGSSRAERPARADASDAEAAHQACLGRLAPAASALRLPAARLGQHGDALRTHLLQTTQAPRSGATTSSRVVEAGLTDVLLAGMSNEMTLGKGAARA